METTIGLLLIFLLNKIQYKYEKKQQRIYNCKHKMYCI